MFLYFSSLNGEYFHEEEVVKDFEFSRFSGGYCYYNRFSCNRFYQLLGIIEDDGSINIRNEFESNFQTHFLCYDDFINYIKEKDFFFKISVILYDEKNMNFHLCRDLFGTTPLYYLHIPDQVLAFSTSLSSLIAIPALDSYLAPNFSRISKYLTWLADGELYSSSTFLLNFNSVLPGEQIILSRSDRSSKPFHSFTFSKKEFVLVKEELGNEFKRLFKISVDRCLSKSLNTSAQLSGGLDSSSICATIRLLEPDKEIHTIYANTDTLFTDEQTFATEVANEIKSEHHVVTPNYNAFETTYLHTSIYGQPEYMQNSSALNRSIITSAVSHGCSNLFSGHPGDAIVGYGKSFIVRLFDSGDWTTLKKSMSIPSQQMENLNLGVDNPSHKIIYSILATKRGILPWYKIIILIFKVSRFFEIPLSYFLKSALRKVKDRFKIPNSILKNADKSNQNKFHEKHTLESVESTGGSDLSSYYNVFATQSILINEEFYILDIYYGIKHEFPFYDKSLFEFCTSVPAEIKYDNGRHRGHLREGMKGILPESVRNRTSKANFGLYGRRATLELYQESEKLLSSSDVWQYVDRKEFQRSVKLLLDDNEKLYVYNRVIFFVSRTIYLAVWLKLLKGRSFQSLIK